jgi:hypothetical protein
MIPRLGEGDHIRHRSDESLPDLAYSPLLKGLGFPKRVVTAHPPNQLASFRRQIGATATPTSRFRRPEEAESFSVPTDDRLPLDNDQGRTPVPPSCCQASQQNRLEAVTFGRLTERSRSLNWCRRTSTPSEAMHGPEDNPASLPKRPLT